MSARAAKGSVLAAGLLQGKWLAAVVSLVVGLGLGTTLGRELLGAAGIPESCVLALQRADTALDTGQSVADDGRAALNAVRDVRVGDALDLLRRARDAAVTLVDEVQRFDDSRLRCDEDRE